MFARMIKVRSNDGLTAILGNNVLISLAGAASGEKLQNIQLVVRHVRKNTFIELFFIELFLHC